MSRETESPREDARAEPPPRVPDLLPDDVGLRPTTDGHVLLPFELLTEPAITKSALRIAAVVARCCSRTTGRYWKRIEVLASECSLPVRTVQASLALLERLGWIARGWICAYGQLRRAIAIRWQRVLPRAGSKRRAALPPATPFLAGVEWDPPRAGNGAPEAQNSAPPNRRSELGFEVRDNVNVVLRPLPDPDAPRTAGAPPGAAAAAPSPPTAPTAPEAPAPPEDRRAGLLGPSEASPLAEAEVADLLEVLASPFRGMAAGAYWTLRDAGQLPPSWADREPPGARPAPEPPPRPRPADVAPVPGPRAPFADAVIAALVAITTANDEQLVDDVERAAMILCRELGDADVNYHRAKLRELAVGRIALSAFKAALKASRSVGVRSRPAIFAAKLTELTGGSYNPHHMKNPAPGHSPKVPGAGPKPCQPPRPHYAVVG
jgi:hypothetical protein